MTPAMNATSDASSDVHTLASAIAARIALPEDLNALIHESVDKAIRDKGLDQVARKAGLFGGEAAPAEYTRAQLARAFLGAKLFQAGGLPLSPVMQKALSEGTPSAGGYFVRDDYRAELIKRVPELSDLFPHVRQIPVGSDTGYTPALATDITITWGRAENDPLTETDPVFGRVTWTIANMSAIAFLSRELVSDSNPRIVDVITELFQEAIAAERDKKIAVGTGSGQPEGLVSVSGIVTVEACSGALEYSKLNRLKFALPRKYHRNASWVMNENTLGWCHGLQDTTTRPILTDALVTGEVPRLLGLPFSTQVDLPDGLIFVGDLSRYLWFDRERMEIETTTSGGDTFSKHQLGIKVVERCDGRLALPDAFRKSGALAHP